MREHARGLCKEAVTVISEVSNRACARNGMEIWLPISRRTVTHMKTTVEIPDDLIKKAKALAASRGTTLRSIIERGIRATLNEERRQVRYELPDRSVSGKGLQAGFQHGEWADIRDTAYSGRGG